MTTTTIADLFAIEPTYKSKSGTGRTCKTVQGYKLVGPVPAGIFNRYSGKKSPWSDLNKWQCWATGNESDLPQGWRGYYRCQTPIDAAPAQTLDWLVRILGADGAPAAAAELARRQDNSETATKAQAASEAEQAALTKRVRETLAAAGFTQAELTRVSVSLRAEQA